MIAVLISGVVAFAMVALAHRPVKVRRSKFNRLNLPRERITGFR